MPICIVKLPSFHWVRENYTVCVPLRPAKGIFFNFGRSTIWGGMQGSQFRWFEQTLPGVKFRVIWSTTGTCPSSSHQKSNLLSGYYRELKFDLSSLFGLGNQVRQIGSDKILACRSVKSIRSQTASASTKFWCLFVLVLLCLVCLLYSLEDMCNAEGMVQSFHSKQHMKWLVVRWFKQIYWVNCIINGKNHELLFSSFNFDVRIVTKFLFTFRRKRIILHFADNE